MNSGYFSRNLALLCNKMKEEDLRWHSTMTPWVNRWRDVLPPVASLLHFLLTLGDLPSILPTFQSSELLYQRVLGCISTGIKEPRKVYLFFRLSTHIKVKSIAHVLYIINLSTRIIQQSTKIEENILVPYLPVYFLYLCVYYGLLS